MWAKIRHTQTCIHTYRYIKTIQTCQHALSLLYFSLLYLSYSLTNTYIHTRTYTLLTMQSNKTVVLHLSMLFMRKWRSGPWVMSSPTEMARPKPLGKPPNPFMKKMNKYINNNSQPNIRGTKLMANCCAGILRNGLSPLYHAYTFM